MTINKNEAINAGKFTKKPVTIDAIKWTGDNLLAVIEFTDGKVPDGRDHFAGMMWEQYTDLVAREGLKIFTLEGKMSAGVGDWIIRGVKGECYPCKPDIFEATYSAATSHIAPDAAAIQAPRHVAYFRKASEYGPWIECHSNAEGCVRFTSSGHASPAIVPDAAIQAEGGLTVPPEWISEVVGGEADDLSYGKGYRRGHNDCRAKVLAMSVSPAIAPEASELPPIKTWQDRCDWASKRTATVLMVQAMKEEIDDLRAAIANLTKKG